MYQVRTLRTALNAERKRCLLNAGRIPVEAARFRQTPTVTLPSPVASSGVNRRQQLGNMSSAAPLALPRTVTRVSDHLVYHQYHPKETKNGKTPMVLFLPWITANEKSAQRFEDVYGKRGFNVLTVWNKVKHFAWPKTSFSLASEVLNYLRAEADCNLVVHGMSIGAYIYTMIIMSAIKDPKSTAYLRDHVKGNVFDSIVCGQAGGLREMALGLSKSVSNKFVVDKLVAALILAYFYVTKSHTVDLYNEAVQSFRDNPFLPSILLFYSTMDHMCNSELIESMAQDWKDRGVHVTLQRWTDSKHVELMKNHTTEYLQRLDEYLDYIRPTVGNYGPKPPLSAKL